MRLMLLGMIVLLLSAIGYARGFTSHMRSDYLNHWDYVYKFSTGVDGELRLDYTTKKVKNMVIHYYDENGIIAYTIKCTGFYNEQKLICNYSLTKEAQRELDQLEPIGAAK